MNVFETEAGKEVCLCDDCEEERESNGHKLELIKTLSSGVCEDCNQGLSGRKIKY